MRKAGLVPLLAAAVLLSAALAPSGASKVDVLPNARDSALAYLAAQGNASAYPPALAPYSVEAAVAAGLDPAAWPTPSASALAAVVVPEEGAPLLRLVRPAHAIALAGGDLSDWHGQDVEARLRAGFDGAQFGDPSLLNDDAYAILALKADGASADDPAVAASVRFLAGQQNADGGWGYAADGESGTDMTGMVMAALALPADDLQTLSAQAFARSTRSDGGFAERPGGAANCDSTVWGLRLLGGADGDGEAWLYFLRLQQPDGGFAYVPGQKSNTLCTAEAATLLGDAVAGRIAAPDYAFEPSGTGIPATAPLLVAVLLVGVAAAARFRRN